MRAMYSGERVGSATASDDMARLLDTLHARKARGSGGSSEAGGGCGLEATDDEPTGLRDRQTHASYPRRGDIVAPVAWIQMLPQDFWPAQPSAYEARLTKSARPTSSSSSPDGRRIARPSFP